MRMVCETYVHHDDIQDITCFMSKFYLEPMLSTPPYLHIQHTFNLTQEKEQANLVSNLISKTTTR